MDLTFYSSGLGRSISDFQGVAESGCPICIALEGLSSTVRDAAIFYNASGGLLLIDSGAYSAATHCSEIDFEKVMADYLSFAKRCRRPDLVMLIAPDILGDQQQTARLQQEYLNEMAAARRTGVSWLIPFQKGWDDFKRYADYANFLRQHLGDFVLGLPQKLNAWEPCEAVQLVKQVDPGQVHLLGLGIRGSRLRPLLGLLWGEKAELKVSHDATRVLANVGNNRPLTSGVDDDIRNHINEHVEEWGKDGIVNFYGEKLGLQESEIESLKNSRDDTGLERLYEKLFETFDDTETTFELLNTPGYLLPVEAIALAKTFNVTDEERVALWADWSQEEADSNFSAWASYRFNFDFCEDDFGCKLGYLLMLEDFSGHLFMLRDPRIWVEHAKNLHLNNRANETKANRQYFRRQRLASISRHDQKRLQRMTVQSAFNF